MESVQYNPGRDARWLLLRPWIAVPRILQIVWALSGLVLSLLIRGNSSDSKVQKNLARMLLRTLTNLGSLLHQGGTGFVHPSRSDPTGLAG